jgi:hypothetical protein
MDRTRTRPARPVAGRLVAGVALVAAMLAGCAQPGARTPGSGGSVTPSGFSFGPSGAGTHSPGQPDPGRSGGAAAPEMTVSGVMRAGVEANCMVLTTAGGTQYQLLGGEPSIYRIGARLTVTGHVTTGVVTTCMQGTLFTVTKVVSVG